MLHINIGEKQMKITTIHLGSVWMDILKEFTKNPCRRDCIENTTSLHCRKKVKVKWSESHSVVSNSLQPHGLYSPWNSPGQNTGVGSHSLSRGSSQLRDWTQVSLTARGFFTSWAIKKPCTVGEVYNGKDQDKDHKKGSQIELPHD